MSAVRLGVRKLEETLEEERGVLRILQEELSRERQEVAAVKEQLSSLASYHSSAELSLSQANETIRDLSQQLHESKAQILALANNVCSAMATSFAEEQSTVSLHHSPLPPPPLLFIYFILIRY